MAGIDRNAHGASLAACQENVTGSIRPVVAIHIACEIARLVQGAHAKEAAVGKKITHVSIFPENVFVGYDGNVEVLNDTADYYRYFDATAHAEFLYACVAQTVEQDLPEEVAFLEAHDRFSLMVQQVVDMPERKVELLRGFLAQNRGRLSRRALDAEFAGLTTGEAEAIETLYAETFGTAGDG